MYSSNRTIRQSIEYLAGTSREDKNYIVDAEVQSVDIENRICTCQLIGGKTGNILTNVRLMADIDDGILIIPTIGSTVVIIFTISTDPIIVGWSEVDKIILRGGDLGGLVRINDLVTKLNNLENIVNDLIAKYNSHIHPGVQTGAGSTGPTTMQETETLTPTVTADLENTAITQG